MVGLGSGAWAQSLRSSMQWLLAGVLGWMLVLTLDAFVGTTPLHPQILAFFLLLGLQLSVLASLPLVFLHLLRTVRMNRGARWTRVWLLVLVAVAAFLPAMMQATFLTSGGNISQHPHVGLVRVTMLVGLVLLWAALWSWHLALGSKAPEARHAGHRRRLWLLRCVGVLFAVMVFWGMQRYVSTYGFFAQHLVPALWLVLATLLLPLMRRLPDRVVAVAMLAIVAIVGVNGRKSSALSVTHFGQQLAGISDQGLFVEPVDLPSLVLADRDPERCQESEPAAFAPLPLSAAQRRNVILISVDTLRRDALDWKRDGAPLMPALAARSGTSLFFTRAVTPYPVTLLALGSIMTGRLPHELVFGKRDLAPSLFQLSRGAVDEELVVFPREWFQNTLAQQFLFSGSSPVLVDGAENQVRLFKSELQRQRREGKSVFAWLHLLEPHSPYREHKGHEIGSSPQDRYKSEVSYVDAQLESLFSLLESEGYFEDSLIVFFSDHGEALGERNYFGHDVYLANWMSDVPLLLWAPHVEGRRSEAAVSTVSITSTVLHFLGLPKPAGIRSRSLFEDPSSEYAISEAFALQGDELLRVANQPPTTRQEFQERLAKVQGGSKKFESKIALTTSRYRLVIHRKTGVEALYDRRDDPAELENLLYEEGAPAQLLRKLMRAWHEAESHRLACLLPE